MTKLESSDSIVPPRRSRSEIASFEPCPWTGRRLSSSVEASSVDDSELEPAALEALVRAHWEPLVRIVRGRLGDFAGRIGPEDLLQRVLLRALQGRARPRNRTPEALYAWALAMTRYEMLHAIRDARRQTAMPDEDEGDELAERRSSTDGTPPARDSLMPAVLELCRDLQELPWEQRVSIVARDFAGVGWETVRLLVERPSLESTRRMHRRGVDLLRALRDRRERPAKDQPHEERVGASVSGRHRIGVDSGSTCVALGGTSKEAGAGRRDGAEERSLAQPEVERSGGAMDLGGDDRAR